MYNFATNNLFVFTPDNLDVLPTTQKYLFIMILNKKM